MVTVNLYLDPERNDYIKSKLDARYSSKHDIIIQCIDRCRKVDKKKKDKKQSSKDLIFSNKDLDINKEMII